MHTRPCTLRGPVRQRPYTTEPRGADRTTREPHARTDSGTPTAGTEVCVGASLGGHRGRTPAPDRAGPAAAVSWDGNGGGAGAATYRAAHERDATTDAVTAAVEHTADDYRARCARMEADNARPLAAREQDRRVADAAVAELKDRYAQLEANHTRTKERQARELFAEVCDDPLVGSQVGCPAIVWDHARRHAAADLAALEQAATLLRRTVAEQEARLAQKDAYISHARHAGVHLCCTPRRGLLQWRAWSARTRTT
jgi:hypothetical protein